MLGSPDDICVFCEINADSEKIAMTKDLSTVSDCRKQDRREGQSLNKTVATFRSSPHVLK